MQVNFNPQQNNQNFGAIHSNEVVNKIIKSRIKKPAQLEKLDRVISEANKNTLADVTLMANPDGKTISANIYSTRQGIEFFKQRSENFFSQVFGGGIVGFIEKCSKIADKGAKKIQQSEQIANSEIFNKMK